MARRLKAIGVPAYKDVVDEKGWTGKVGVNLEAMRVPGTGKMVFCQSMGDLFYEGVTDEDILWAYNEIRKLTLQGNTVQVLTKRPERAAAILPRMAFDNSGRGSMYFLPEKAVPPVPFVQLLSRHWFGWTAENQEWIDKRARFGMQVPAAVRFVSFEPLLAPVDISPWLEHFTHPTDGLRHSKDGVGPWHSPWLDWVIVGCETGPGRRWCDNRWVEDIVKQCYAAKVPVFVKKLHKLGTGRLPVIVDDINEISNLLGYPPEQLRQFPMRIP